MIDTPDDNGSEEEDDDMLFSDWDPEEHEEDQNEEPVHQDRFDLYPDQELVTVIQKGKLDNICERFQELSMLASIVLDVPVDQLEREDVLDYIKANR